MCFSRSIEACKGVAVRIAGPGAAPVYSAAMAETSTESSSGDSLREGATAPGLDTLLDQLETVVRDLEQGQLSLEGAMARFEEGVGLARESTRVLDALEDRIEVLVAGARGPEPFEPDGEARDEETK